MTDILGGKSPFLNLGDRGVLAIEPNAVEMNEEGTEPGVRGMDIP